jgi:8-oxo-dGTP pyrophosphatase MutT (NUDIX family)
MKSIHEVSCGCVPFRKSKNGSIEVLLIYRDKGFWEFPKGKKDTGETDIETAMRELREETGLTGEIFPHQNISAEYTFTRGDSRVHKTVIFFLCKVDDTSQVVLDQKEVVDSIWLSPEDVVKKIDKIQLKEVAEKIVNVLRI